MSDLRRPVRGFTLLELLVAITVLSLVSLISWRGLESLTATRMRLEPEAGELRALLTVFGQMEFDVAQLAEPSLVPLPVQPIAIGTGSGATLEIVRFAAVESNEASALQRVVYRLADGKLTRSVSTAIRTPALLSQVPLSEATLLGDVRTMQVRLWRRGQGWVDASVGVAPAPDNPFGLPDGLEVTLERNDGTRVRRVLVIG